MSVQEKYSGHLPTWEDGRPITVEPEAWGFYVTPGQIGKRCERVRNYVPIQDTLHLAEALCRPVGVEDFKILVQSDGGFVICSVTGKEFQPIRWVPVSRWLCDKLRGGKTLAELAEEECLRYQGHFFVSRGQVFAYSGTPFRFAKGYPNDRWNEGSPLVRAFHLNQNRWGLIRETTEELVARHNHKREEIVRMDNEISRQIGGWRPSRRQEGGNKRRGNDTRFTTTQGKCPKKTKREKTPAGDGEGLSLEDFSG